jgi:hypothetical protein
MKKALVFVTTLLCGSAALAHSGYSNGSIVSWRNIVGVITAPGIDNPVAIITDADGDKVLSQISSGTLPWKTRSGTARVDLTSGHVEFSVRGLVLVGGNTTGTANPINQVIGTLVCNPGSADQAQPQAIIDTRPVALSALGKARFSGGLTQPVPDQCESPLFLIRIGPAFGAFAGRWLAAGVEPRQGNGRDFDRDEPRNETD